MTFQEAREHLKELNDGSDEHDLSPRGRAEQVLLAEIATLQNRLDKLEPCFENAIKLRDEHWLAEIEKLREALLECHEALQICKSRDEEHHLMRSFWNVGTGHKAISHAREVYERTSTK